MKSLILYLRLLSFLPQKRANYSLFFTCILFVSLSGHAYPTKDLKKVGQGTMSWMFIDIYDAEFFTSNGKYKPNQFPQVLTITYLKDIKQKRLIDATKEQWVLQGQNSESVKRWIAILSDIWPDIQQGDKLTFYVEQNKKGTFFHNGQAIGHIKEQAFSMAFLSIWLSEKTSQPELRQQLLGVQ